MEALCKLYVYTAKALLQWVNYKPLLCGFLAKDRNNFSACWSSLLQKNPTTSFPLWLFWFYGLKTMFWQSIVTAPLIPPFSGLIKIPEIQGIVPAQPPTLSKNAAIQLCNSWGKCPRKSSTLHAPSLAKWKKRLNGY